MIAFLFSMAGLLNLLFYIFAVGFLISLGLEQWIKFRPLSVDASMNERNTYIVQSNRKYCWRQAWVTNVYWFLCNVGLYFISRSMATPTDTFWNGIGLSFLLSFHCLLIIYLSCTFKYHSGQMIGQFVL